MKTSKYVTDVSSCDNCDWQGPTSKLKEIQDLHERIDPGGIVPSGECPKCGCLAYPVMEEDKPDKDLATTSEIAPNGDRGHQPLTVVHNARFIMSKGFAEGASADFDWYNDKLQILVFDRSDDPALHVRFNRNGKIAEILVRDDLMSSPWGYAGPLIKLESSREPSKWEIARDGKPTTNRPAKKVRGK